MSDPRDWNKRVVYVVTTGDVTYVMVTNPSPLQVMNHRWIVMKPVMMLCTYFE